MSLDQLGRDAAQGARRAAEAGTDVTTGLVDVRRRHHRHQTTVRASTVSVLLAIVVAVALLVRGGTQAPPPVQPDPTPTCATAVCQGIGEYRVDLRAPLTWTVPQGWEQHLAGGTVAARPVGATGRSPLVVIEDIRGGEYASQAQAPTDAATVAEWMTTAPQLRVSGVSTTTLAGLPATHLTIEPTTGYLLLGTKLAIPVEDRLDDTWFADQSNFDISGYLGRDKVYVATPGEKTEVWLLDVPGGGATAVVAPASTDPAVVTARQSLLDSMSFAR